MRKLIFAAMATAILSAPMTLVVRADDTTVIKRDNDGDRIKRDDVNVLPVPHVEEKKTIIKKEDE
jgi:hypothetical protein